MVSFVDARTLKPPYGGFRVFPKRFIQLPRDRNATLVPVRSRDSLECT
jgi:hypothetical protein